MAPGAAHLRFARRGGGVGGRPVPRGLILGREAPARGSLCVRGAKDGGRARGGDGEAGPAAGAAGSPLAGARSKLAAARELARRLVEERAALRAVATAEEMLRMARSMGPAGESRVAAAEAAAAAAREAQAAAEVATGRAAEAAAAANEEARSQSRAPAPSKSATNGASATAKPAQAADGAKLIGGRTAEEWEIFALGRQSEKVRGEDDTSNKAEEASGELGAPTAPAAGAGSAAAADVEGRAAEAAKKAKEAKTSAIEASQRRLEELKAERESARAEPDAATPASPAPLRPPAVEEAEAAQREAAEAQAQAAAQRESEEAARREAEAQAQREAEEAQAQAQAAAQREAEEAARREAAAQAQREAEEAAAQREADAARREAEAEAQREAAAAGKAQAEAQAQAQAQTEAQARKQAALAEEEARIVAANAAAVAEAAERAIIATEREGGAKKKISAEEEAAYREELVARNELMSEAILAANELAAIENELSSLQQDAVQNALAARRAHIEEAQQHISTSDVINERFFTVPSRDVRPGSLLSVFYRANAPGALYAEGGVVMRCGFDGFWLAAAEVEMKPFDASYAVSSQPNVPLGTFPAPHGHDGWMVATVRVPTIATSFACVFHDSSGSYWDNNDNANFECDVSAEFGTSREDVAARCADAADAWWDAVSSAAVEAAMRPAAAAAQARTPALRTAAERRARGALAGARLEAAERVAERIAARERNESQGALSYKPGVYAIYRPPGYWDEPSMQHDDGYAILVYNRDAGPLSSNDSDGVVACHVWYDGTAGIVVGEGSGGPGDAARHACLEHGSREAVHAFQNFWGDALAVTSDGAAEDVSVADATWGAAFVRDVEDVDIPPDCAKVERAEFVTYHMRPVAPPNPTGGYEPIDSAASIGTTSNTPFESVDTFEREGGGVGVVARSVRPGGSAACPRVPFEVMLPSSNEELPMWAFQDPNTRQGRWYATVVYLPRRVRSTLKFVFSDVHNHVYDNNEAKDYEAPVRFHEQGSPGEDGAPAPRPRPDTWSIVVPALASRLGSMAESDWGTIAAHAVASAGDLTNKRVAERLSVLRARQAAHLSVAALLPAGSSLALGRLGKLVYRTIGGPLYGHCFAGRAVFAALSYNRGSPGATAAAEEAGLPRIVRMTAVSSADPTWPALAGRAPAESAPFGGAALTDDIGSGIAAAFEADLPALPDWVERVDASFAMDAASAAESVYGAIEAMDLTANADMGVSSVLVPTVPNGEGLVADARLTDVTADARRYRSQLPRLVDDNGGLLYNVYSDADGDTMDVQPLHIVHVAVECAPIAKVGGLADVVHALGCESVRVGHRVSVCLPYYDVGRYDNVRFIMNADNKPSSDSFHFEDQDWRVYRGALEVEADGAWWFDAEKADAATLPVFLFSNETTRAFDQGCVYGRGAFDAESFRDFSRAAVFYTCAHQGPLYSMGGGFAPVDVVHGHDWSSSYANGMLAELAPYMPQGYAAPPSVLTVHNLHYGAEHVMHHARMSGALVAVSPTYAREISENNGRMLEPLPSPHGTEPSAVIDTLYGIVNGVESSTFDPRCDPALGPHFAFDAESVVAGKRACKVRWFVESCARNGYDARHSMLRQLMDSGKPLVGYIGRLANQKGLDLVKHAGEVCCARGIPFLLLGAASDGGVAADFERWKHHIEGRYPDQVVSINLGFDELFSRWCYAACDVMVVPSVFEPCGLTQLVAMRYGALPLVRCTGGLADTVVDVDDEVHGTAADTCFVAGERHDTAAVEEAGENVENALLQRAFPEPLTEKDVPRNRRVSDTHPPPFQPIRASAAGRDPKGCGGFVFHDVNQGQMEAALVRAVELYEFNPDEWTRRVRRNMNQDLSWASSAADYRELYHLVTRRGRLT